MATGAVAAAAACAAAAAAAATAAGKASAAGTLKGAWLGRGFARYECNWRGKLPAPRLAVGRGCKSSTGFAANWSTSQVADAAKCRPSVAGGGRNCGCHGSGSSSSSLRFQSRLGIGSTGIHRDCAFSRPSGLSLSASSFSPSASASFSSSTHSSLSSPSTSASPYPPFSPPTTSLSPSSSTSSSSRPSTPQHQSAVLLCPSEGAVAAVAQRMARVVPLCAGDVICLHGPIGAGKTAFCRHLIRALVGEPHLPVPSPTFLLMNEYSMPDTGEFREEDERGDDERRVEARAGVAREGDDVRGSGHDRFDIIHHYDAFRISPGSPVDHLDLRTSLEEALTLVEWPHHIAHALPPHRCIHVHIGVLLPLSPSSLSSPTSTSTVSMTVSASEANQCRSTGQVHWSANSADELWARGKVQTEDGWADLRALCGGERAHAVVVVAGAAAEGAGEACEDEANDKDDSSIAGVGQAPPAGCAAVHGIGVSHVSWAVPLDQMGSTPPLVECGKVGCEDLTPARSDAADFEGEKSKKLEEVEDGAEWRVVQIRVDMTESGRDGADWEMWAQQRLRPWAAAELLAVRNDS